MTAGLGETWVGGRALATEPPTPGLDLDYALGQRQATFRFALTDAVSGLHLGDVHPYRTAVLRHSTSMGIKRQLDLALSVSDTAAINTVTDRISPFMVIPGVTCPDTDSGDWPLGTYMFADGAQLTSTGGNRSNPSLTDEMFIVDQAILKGLSGIGRQVQVVILDVLEGLPVVFDMEPSPYISADAWGIGTARGQILETLSVSGDYWSPWFDNRGRLRFVRTFDPAARVPDINLDIGGRVIRDTPLETDDILTAPNTFVVISNAPSNVSEPCVGIATVPVTAPNSVPNRGFAITKVLDIQLTDPLQAQAVAQGLVERQAISEQVSLSTPPDPRHDSYNVIRWQGVNWLETAWSMPLKEGASMTHTLRRSYN